MAPRCRKMVPRGPKMTQDGPKRPQDGPKMAQDGSENVLESQLSTYKRTCRILRNLRCNRHLREVPREAKRHQDDPKRPQDGPKMAPRCLKMAARGPKIAPRGAQRSPQSSPTYFGPRKTKHLSATLGPCFVCFPWRVITIWPSSFAFLQRGAVANLS